MESKREGEERGGRERVGEKRMVILMRLVVINWVGGEMFGYLFDSIFITKM